MVVVGWLLVDVKKQQTTTNNQINNNFLIYISYEENH